MMKLAIADVKRIAKEYGLSPSRVKGTEVVNIRKHASPQLEDISWEEFERILRQRGLAVYKATNSDFLRIMRAK